MRSAHSRLTRHTSYGHLGLGLGQRFQSGRAKIESVAENETARTADLYFDEFYAKSLSAFTSAVEKAIVTSHQCASRNAGPRLFWTSVLFTRICSTGISILLLSPGSPVNRNASSWDFSSVASLCRNIFESALTMYYLGIDQVSNEEWAARLRVAQVHDCMGRFRMFRDFDSNDPDLPKFQEEADELRLELKANAFFMTLPEAQRKKLLNGEQACILSQDQILQRMGEFDQGMRGYYRFLSSHTHSFPLAFYRMAEHNLGRGAESDVEKGYIAGAIEFAGKVVVRATEDMREAFKDVVTFVPGTFDWHRLHRQ